MSKESNNYAETAMLIRKPAAEVFDAFIDPDITTKFWFTKSSGKLKEGSSTDWTWEMYDHTFTVIVKEIIPDEKILIQWGDDPDAIVCWNFKSLGDRGTFVSIKSEGFKGTNEEILNQVRDATGGFTWVLAGAKAYLEHGLELGLIGDRYPKELGIH